MAEKVEKLNQYEGMFLLGQMAATEPQAAIDLCRSVIERHGGQVMVIKKWDERRLAYEIGGQKRGTYILSFFKASGNAVAGIERDVKLSEQILRVMVLRADHLNQQEMEAIVPQPIVQREERPMESWDRPYRDRPDRGDRGGDRGDRAPRPRRDEAAPAAAPTEESAAAKD